MARIEYSVDADLAPERVMAAITDFSIWARERYEWSADRIVG